MSAGVRGKRTQIKDRFNNKNAPTVQVSSRDDTQRGSSVMEGFTPFQSEMDRNPESFYADSDTANQLKEVGLAEPTKYYSELELERNAEAKAYYDRNTTLCAKITRILSGKTPTPTRVEIHSYLDKLPRKA